MSNIAQASRLAYIKALNKADEIYRRDCKKAFLASVSYSTEFDHIQPEVARAAAFAVRDAAYAAAAEKRDLAYASADRALFNVFFQADSDIGAANNQDSVKQEC